MILNLFLQTARLDFSFNRIEGTIQPDISALTNIAFLDLSYNELYGSIGTYMGSLSNLGKSRRSNVKERHESVSLCISPRNAKTRK
jgi:hypothetical protein